MARADDFVIRGRVELTVEPPAIPLVLWPSSAETLGERIVKVTELARLRQALERENRNLEHRQDEWRRADALARSLRSQCDSLTRVVNEMKEKLDAAEHVEELEAENMRLREEIATLRGNA